jgi:hypothetical protein
MSKLGHFIDFYIVERKAAKEADKGIIQLDKLLAKFGHLYQES